MHPLLRLCIYFRVRLIKPPFQILIQILIPAKHTEQELCLFLRSFVAQILLKQCDVVLIFHYSLFGIV